MLAPQEQEDLLGQLAAWRRTCGDGRAAWSAGSVRSRNWSSSRLLKLRQAIVELLDGPPEGFAQGLDLLRDLAVLGTWLGRTWLTLNVDSLPGLTLGDALVL
jgi:hypothetical protein